MTNPNTVNSHGGWPGMILLEDQTRPDRFLKVSFLSREAAPTDQGGMESENKMWKSRFRRRGGGQAAVQYRRGQQQGAVQQHSRGGGQSAAGAQTTSVAFPQSSQMEHFSVTSAILTAQISEDPCSVVSYIKSSD